MTAPPAPPPPSWEQSDGPDKARRNKLLPSVTGRTSSAPPSRPLRVKGGLPPPSPPLAPYSHTRDTPPTRAALTFPQLVTLTRGFTLLQLTRSRPRPSPLRGQCRVASNRGAASPTWGRDVQGRCRQSRLSPCRFWGRLPFGLLRANGGRGRRGQLPE